MKKVSVTRGADERSLFERENIWSILFQIAPPVMLAQLIQALYNIVDSYFVGKYSGDGLTALSVIFPVQLIVIAVAVGTGVGVNTLMSRYFAQDKREKARKAAGTGTALAAASWLVFAAVSLVALRPYVAATAQSEAAVEYAVTYGRIVCVGSLGMFLESVWTKVHQAGGNMRLPMVAQCLAALTNIVLDPILIFSCGLGIAGAAYATVAGQFAAALITVSGFQRPPGLGDIRRFAGKIYRLGYPSILMQMLYTVYIMALNVILAGFCDEAVTVLGLYYKLQIFFFIPLTSLQTCIVPLLSYTFAQQKYRRCQEIMRKFVGFSLAFMLLGAVCFGLFPRQLLGIFSSDAQVLAIGEPAFRIIAVSFPPAVLSLMTPVFFQAIGEAVPSVMLSLTRQIFCLIPIFWGMSLLGLEYTWLAYPLSETITGLIGVTLYCRQLRGWGLRVSAVRRPPRRRA